MAKKFEILCVDDEPQILEGLKLHLNRHFVVHVAGSGADALALLALNPNIAVILSDMRMPHMDGAKFLNAARVASPDSVRMLLTGYTDMQSAIAAVNEGQIFRFISKPCPPDQMIAAFGAALGQHKLLVSEKILLQQTLLGCVETLAKVLSLTKPTAFGRALRLRAKVHALIEHLHWQDQWQAEAAAVLSQLGAVTLSEETLIKLNEGESLDDDDRREVAASIDASVEMLGEIPRLEPVVAILQYLAGTLRPGRTPLADVPAGGSLLRIAMDWDGLEATGLSQSKAFEQLTQTGGYDETILACGRQMGAGGAQSNVMPTAFRDLAPGMVLAQDLVRHNGVMILPRGFEIDKALLEHIHTFALEWNDEPIMVSKRA
jgi:CheY-like chemotaxis protein